VGRTSFQTKFGLNAGRISFQTKFGHVRLGHPLARLALWPGDFSGVVHRRVTPVAESPATNPECKSCSRDCGRDCLAHATFTHTQRSFDVTLASTPLNRASVRQAGVSQLPPWLGLASWQRSDGARGPGNPLGGCCRPPRLPWACPPLIGSADDGRRDGGIRGLRTNRERLHSLVPLGGMRKVLLSVPRRRPGSHFATFL
jgi:hypothetical protein